MSLTKVISPVMLDSPAKGGFFHFFHIRPQVRPTFDTISLSTGVD